MGRGNGRVAGKGDETRFASSVNLRLSLILLLGFRCGEEEEEVVRSAALPSSSQTVTRGRGQGRASGNGNFTGLALPTIHFGHCQSSSQSTVHFHIVSFIS
ncbi:hypothetical protein COP1_045962 [Malus domestica]